MSYESISIIFIREKDIFNVILICGTIITLLEQVGLIIVFHCLKRILLQYFISMGENGLLRSGLRALYGLLFLRFFLRHQELLVFDLFIRGARGLQAKFDFLGRFWCFIVIIETNLWHQIYVFYIWSSLISFLIEEHGVEIKVARRSPSETKIGFEWAHFIVLHLYLIKFETVLARNDRERLVIFTLCEHILHWLGARS